MKFLQGLFYKFLPNLLACFSGVNLIWHGLAIALTYLLASSGFDWEYYNFFHQGRIYYLMLPATVLGFLTPLILPLILWIRGRHHARALNTGFAVAQAAVLGWLISSTYKAFTGRLHPEAFIQTVTDISHTFNFGFLRGGIFWGWPSSHTAVAFAVTFALLILYPESRRTKVAALLCAFYIGLGVSISIHWFSDFVAGAIIGTVVGVVVGRSFLKRKL